MLHISETVQGVKNEYRWHFGEPFPAITGRVVTYQADGDELNFLMWAIKDRLDLYKKG